MPSRPERHQLEDISRAKFQLALPSNWIFRDKPKDYGIDGEVEIFDDKNNATGLFFWVQLKSTESVKSSSVKSVSLSIDTIKYYKKLETPILLVRYSVNNDIYIKWVHNVDLFYAKKKAKSYSISFSESDKWTVDSPEKVIRHLLKYRAMQTGAFSFPIKLSVKIEDPFVKEISNGIILSQLRSNIQKYSAFIKYTASEEEALMKVFLNNRTLSINASERTSFTFHSIDKRKEKHFSEEIVQDILLGIAWIMTRFGQIEFCGRIIFESHLGERLMEKQELLIQILPKLFQSSHFEITLSLISKLMDRNIIDPKLQMITYHELLYHSHLNTESKNLVIEKFFLNRLSKARKKLDIGTANYNLGNYYRSKRSFKLAIKHYIAAKRYAPIYLNQHYYYSELAGCFFLLDHFGVAAKLYEKSLALGAAGILIHALYADTLMFSGEYEKAASVFEKYIHSTTTPNEEFLLKYMCLKNLFEPNGYKRQNRNIKAAQQLTDTSKLNDETEIIAQLEKALQLDALCQLAWFNLGVIWNKRQEVELATYAFLMAALIHTGDLEAWSNATLSSMNKKVRAEIGILIVKTAYFFNKESYTEKLYSIISDQKIPMYLKQTLIEFVERVLPHEKHDSTHPFSLRLLNRKGIFEDTLEKKEG